MKKTIFTCLMASLCLMQAYAQKETKKFSIGIGLEAGVPTGQIADAYNLAFGLSLRLSFHAGPGFVTFTSGAIGYSPKTLAGQSAKVGLEVPFRAGYKYIVQHHLFLMGELGYSSLNTYYGKNGSVSSTTTSSVTAAPSIGYQANAFEIGLRYGLYFNNVSGGVIGLRIGFNF